MKITIKTVAKGAGGAGAWDMDVVETDTVLQVKQKIQADRPEFEADSCKLVCAGRILQNDKTIADSAVKEGDFCVIIPGKKAPAPAPAAPAAAAAPAPAAPAAAAGGDAPPPPPPVAAQVAQGGAESEAALQQLTDMGFPRDQCVAALRAAFGNPDRAVEYLFNGIPAEEQAPPAAAGGAPAVPAAGGAPAAPAAAGGAPSAAAGFQGAAFPAMPGAGGAAPAPGGAAAGGAANPLAGMNPNDPQMQAMMQAVQQNPQMLQQVLGQLAQTNPEMVQALQQNPQMLMQLLAGGMGGGEGGMGGGAPGAGGPPPGAIQVQLNEDERAAVARLEELGFPRAAVIQAYLACEKNEEQAANFLFENGDDY